MLHTLPILARHHYGRSIYTLVTSPSIHEGNQLPFQPTIWPTFHLYVVSFRISHTPLITFQLPDEIEDAYKDLFGKNISPSLLTQLKRELVHAIWTLILDGNFMHTYEHGIIIKFSDGIECRVYPRFFTYSADYPEK